MTLPRLPKAKTTNTRPTTKNASNDIKQFLQSYLRWLYDENPNFTTNLTNDEITNYFLNKIHLPVWLNEKLTSNQSFSTIAKIAEYLARYKNDAFLFKQDKENFPKIEITIGGKT